MFYKQIIGTLFLAVGIFVKVGAAKYIEPTLESAFGSISGLGSSLSISSYDSSGTFDISKLGELLNPVAIVFIVFGAFLLIMCILGSIGLCCKVQCVLYVVSTTPNYGINILITRYHHIYSYPLVHLIILSKYCCDHSCHILIVFPDTNTLLKNVLVLPHTS
jgi:hypothetical protein